MNSNRESFVLHHETGEMVKKLSDDKAGKLIKAIFTFSMTGEVVEVAPSIQHLYQGMINTMAREFVKYEETCARNKRAADKRWEKQRGKAASAAQPPEIGTIDEVPMYPKDMRDFGENMRAHARASEPMHPHTNGIPMQSPEKSRYAKSCYPNPKPEPNPDLQKNPEPAYDPDPEPDYDFDLDPYGGNAATARIPAGEIAADSFPEELSAISEELPAEKNDHPSESDQEEIPLHAHGPHKNVMLTKGQFETLYHYDRLHLDQELKKLSNEIAKGKTFEDSHFAILTHRLTTQRIIAKNVRYD